MGSFERGSFLRFCSDSVSLYFFLQIKCTRSHLAQFSKKFKYWFIKLKILLITCISNPILFYSRGIGDSEEVPRRGLALFVLELEFNLTNNTEREQNVWLIIGGRRRRIGLAAAARHSTQPRIHSPQPWGGRKNTSTFRREGGGVTLAKTLRLTTLSKLISALCRILHRKLSDPSSCGVPESPKVTRFFFPLSPCSTAPATTLPRSCS